MQYAIKKDKDWMSPEITKYGTPLQKRSVQYIYIYLRNICYVMLVILTGVHTSSRVCRDTRSWNQAEIQQELELHHCAVGLAVVGLKCWCLITETLEWKSAAELTATEAGRGSSSSATHITPSSSITPPDSHFPVWSLRMSLGPVCNRSFFFPVIFCYILIFVACNKIRWLPARHDWISVN